MRKYINISFSLLLGFMLFSSCESLLDVEPEEVLLSEDYLGDDSLDARSALFGLLAQMQDVAGQYVVLGEMRADLVNVTSETVEELRQINTHSVNEDNSFIDPTNLFSIINNCNFALEGIDTESNKNELLENYASILRIRTWAQLQILINYGKLPYITKPIKNDDDLKETHPLLSFEQGINQLIQNLEPITNVENVSKYENSLGFNIFNMIPDQDILLGDLNLWKGNYAVSATYYKQFLDKFVIEPSSVYNLTSSNGITVNPSGTNYSLLNSWINIFNENVRTNEVINYVGYSEQYRQPNNMFSVLTNQMEPSTSIIQNFAEQSLAYEKEAVQLGDSRSSVTINPTSGLVYYSKYSYDYITLYRAAKIYLRYAEAINYAGYPYHALTIVNGIFNDPNTLPNDALVFDNDDDFLNFEKEQYYTVNSGNVPTGGNLGVRGRVSMAAVSIDSGLSLSEAITAAGKLILNEAALELAFEGNRWEDLLRFARRDNDPSILADAVASKFEISGDLGTAATVQQKLMNPENWNLPLTISDNFVPAN